MRMREARYGLDLLEKSLRSKRCSDVGVENLHCHIASVARVASTINRCHTATAELALYGIAIAERVVRRSLCGQITGEETKPYSAPISEKSTCRV
jgi:hypothetical protein